MSTDHPPVHPGLGLDQVKDSSVVVPTDDDAQGLTTRFNRNLLGCINRELDGAIPWMPLPTARHGTPRLPGS